MASHDQKARANNASQQNKGALDLGSLHKERMARQAAQTSKKRERSISPRPLSDARKAPKLETSTVSFPSGAKLNMLSEIVKDDQQSRKSHAANANNSKLLASSQNAGPEASLPTPPSSQPNSIQYPEGVVKKTWAFGHPRTGRDIKLEEVIEAQTLRTAVLSAFQWDMDWVFTKLKVPPNGGSTKCVFIMQAKEQAMKDDMMKQTEDYRAWLRLCFPPMLGQTHCMHSKLMLLFHPNKLRIAVPTANLLNFDWGETGQMENSVWMIDLPRLPNGEKTALGDMTGFGKNVLHFLQKQELDQDVRDGMLNFDYRATVDIAFVHTVGGVSCGENAARTGLPGLAKAVQQHNLQTTNLQIDFAASSIGSLNDDFLRHVHAAASGENMTERADAAVAKAKASFFEAKKSTAKPSDHAIRDHIRIYFPTHETVTSSKAGAAGTICLSRKWWEAMTFPRRCFRDYISLRPGLLSHNKILYARGSRKGAEGEEDKQIAWAYVGSSNMSESAWGKLVYDKKEKQWKLNCRNWECGVLLPVDVDGKSSDEAGVVSMEVFNGVVEPPFILPGPEYDKREPWYFKEAE